MWNYIWPALLIVGSNFAYHIVAKGTPAQVNPFASLLVTYLTGAAAAIILYFLTAGGQSLKHSLSQLNWTSYALGFAIVGLEAGYLCLYRAGWNISTGSLICNMLVAILLLAVGILFYRESLGLKQIVGALLCMGGLVMLNLK